MQLPNNDNCVIVIPALNEADTIAEIVCHVNRKGFKVVVVDDASTDKTVENAQKEGAIVLPLVFNIGAWNAIQAGIRYALHHNYQYVITMDADGQHDPDSIQQLIDAYHADPTHHVITGSCTSRGNISRQLSWRFFKTISGLEINDLTSGFRLYDTQALKLLAHKRATTLEYQDVGILLLLNQYGLNIGETPVQMNPRQEGESRLFNSRFKIMYYLYYTLILSLSKIKASKNKINR